MRTTANLCLTGLFVFLIACTRQASQSSSLSLNFSNIAKAKVLTGQTIGELVINVTQSGSSTPISYRWVGATLGGPAVNITPPSSVNIAVDAGTTYIVQALVITGTGGGGTVELNYGDQSITITGSSATANITTSTVGTGLSNDNIAGRYLGVGGYGPTGHVLVSYLPPGKPPVLISQDREIFSGWFGVYAIEGAQFSYVTDSGIDLFGGSVDVSQNTLLGTTAVSAARTLRAYIPGSFTSQNGNTPPLPALASIRNIVGWFGPGGSSKQVCFSTATESVQNVFQTASGSSAILWNATAPGADDGYVETANGFEGGVGATEDASGLCALAGTRFQDYLSFNDEQAANGNGILSFNGPFQMSPSGEGQQDLFVSTSGNIATFNWTYLPGVERDLAGVDLFARVEVGGVSTEDYKTNSGVACASLQQSFGFDLLANVPVNSDPTILAASKDVDLTGKPTLLTAIRGQSASLIACPYALVSSVKTYFSTAATIQPCTSCSSFSTAPTNVALTLVHSATPSDSSFGAEYSFSDNTQQISSCKAYDIMTSQALPAGFSTVLNLMSSFGTSFYTDSACTTQLTPNSLTLSTGSPHPTVYLATTATSQIDTIRINGAGAEGVALLYVVPSTLPAPTALTYNYSATPNSIVVGQCAPLNLQFMASGSPTVELGSDTVPLNLPGTFYANASDCNSSQNSITGTSITPYTAGVTVYYKPNSSGNPYASQISGTKTNNNVPVSGNIAVDLAALNATEPYGLSLNGDPFSMDYINGYFTEPGCSPVQIFGLTSPHGAYVLEGLLSANTLSLVSTTGGAFYSNATCSGGGSVTASYTIQATQLYFKNTGATATFTINGVAAPSINFYPASMQLQATGPDLCTGGTDCGIGAKLSFRDANNNPWFMPVNIPALAMQLGSVSTTSSSVYYNGSSPVSSSCGGQVLNSFALGSPTLASQIVMSLCANNAGSAIITANFNNKVLSNNLPVNVDAASAGSFSSFKILGPVALQGSTVPTSANIGEELDVFTTDASGHWVSTSLPTPTLSLTGAAGDKVCTSSDCSSPLLDLTGTSSSTSASVPSAASGAAAALYFTGPAGTTAILDYSASSTATLSLTPH